MSDQPSTPSTPGSVSRRDFLRVGSLSVVGLSLAEQRALASARTSSGGGSCILILMSGGPSQYETFDPKPDAPAWVRGPSRSIATAVPGVRLNESLPRLAERMNRFSLVRTLHHDAAPIHEAGLQLLQTGHLAGRGGQYPPVGSVVSQLHGDRGRIPAFVTLPRLLTATGVSASRGQTAGFLGSQHDPITALDQEVDTAPEEPTAVRNLASGLDSRMAGISVTDEPEHIRRSYGENRFGRLCLQARRLVECGVRCVTINLFDELAGRITWDCHGHAETAPATLFSYRDLLCPQFDRAVSALLDDLEQRDLLRHTLVAATGEFGRTAKVNTNVGRDHWTGAWSALVAGGGTVPGQVIGETDPLGETPQKRPVHVGELVATMYHSLGIDPARELETEEGKTFRLTEHTPIGELFS
ncbi:MAG: DUF1501 domain-containing protein [Planctomycetaceae bacterium]|nr:DUF1501 domain-containing protein [Planctomycetaceae bacterium]